MYTKPVIFKIYSVFIFVFTIAASVTVMVGANYYANTVAEFVVNLWKKELEAIGGPVSPFQFIYVCAFIVIILICLILLLYSYVEFTSMFTFAQMIEHEKKDSSEPFRRMRIVLPPKFYKVFGKAMFFVPLILSCLVALGMVILLSKAAGVFLVIPVIPIFIIAVLMVLMYITNYCRFNTFGDLLELKSSKNVSVKTINSLGENKPNTLRAYCIFLYICCIISLVIAVVKVVFTILHSLLGISDIWMYVFRLLVYILTPAVNFIVYGIIGCYYDNLGKMIEHYMIKYKTL